MHRHSIRVTNSSQTERHLPRPHRSSPLPKHSTRTFLAMNSINEQQRERNHENLTGRRAIERIKETVDKAQTCFFCTGGAVVGADGIRPMNVRKVDDDGVLWFLSASDSHKNQELDRTSEVVLLFQGSPHSDFLQLSGTASVSRDPQKIKELWEPVLKTWFTEGVDDPRITVIKV
jgi:general stress protein 26